MVENAIRQVPGVSDAHVELVWDPPWTQERMSEEALLQLGMM
jgi:metal-sulfur cluster biosynthetic enzyme